MRVGTELIDPGEEASSIGTQTHGLRIISLVLYH